MQSQSQYKIPVVEQDYIDVYNYILKHDLYDENDKTFFSNLTEFKEFHEKDINDLISLPISSLDELIKSERIGLLKQAITDKFAEISKYKTEYSFLTYNPNITYFNAVYRRYSIFSQEAYEYNSDGRSQSQLHFSVPVRHVGSAAVAASAAAAAA